MYSKFYLVVAAFVCLGLSNEAQAKKERKSKAEVSAFTCKEMQTYIAKEAMEAMAECQSKLGLNTREERKGKLMCILKCIGIEEGLLNAEGHVSKEGIDTFMEEHVPDRFHAAIYPVLNDCVFNIELKIDPADEFCMSYKPIVKCVMKWVGYIDQKNLCELYDAASESK